MTSELRQNPQTGQWEAVPVAPSELVGLRKSYFCDETDAGAYHFVLPLDAHSVYVRELGDADFESYLHQEAALHAQIDALQAADEGDATTTHALLREQQELALWVLERCVVGWDLPRPFAPSTLALLSVAAGTALASALLARTSLGQDAEFLIEGKH